MNWKIGQIVYLVSGAWVQRLVRGSHSSWFEEESSDERVEGSE